MKATSINMRIGAGAGAASHAKQKKNIGGYIASNQEKEEECCCNENVKKIIPKYHFIMKSNRKEAEEAARHYKNANGVELHPHNTKDNYPHFHPTRNGVKIPGAHFQFPG